MRSWGYNGKIYENINLTHSDNQKANQPLVIERKKYISLCHSVNTHLIHILNGKKSLLLVPRSHGDHWIGKGSEQGENRQEYGSLRRYFFFLNLEHNNKKKSYSRYDEIMFGMGRVGRSCHLKSNNQELKRGREEDNLSKSDVVKSEMPCSKII